MGKNLAIIGASYLQLPLIERAKELGYVTHVFAWEAKDVGEDAADYFYPISIVEKEQILEKCKEINICGICSIASDLATITVNYVACRLGLNGNSIKATEVSTNKHLMRLAFEKKGVPSPKSILVDEFTDLKKVSLKYPLIVKPTDRSGSRGICKLKSCEGLEDAVKQAIQSSFEKKALIEEFVEGEEYSVEYISYAGVHYFLALTKKFTTGAPYFIETAHLEPAPVDMEILKEIQRIVSHALDSLEIFNSASHTELKITPDGEVYIIEIGGRMGGDCIGSDLVKYSTGIDFVRCVIQVACGIEPDMTPICVPTPVKSTFIFDERDVEIMDRIKKEKPESLLKIAYFNPALIGKATDSSNRAGCYIIKV